VERPEVQCTGCHTDGPEVLDFSALGYSPGRVRSLATHSVVEHAAAIERGEKFYLPAVLTAPTSPFPATAAPLPPESPFGVGRSDP